MPVSSPIQGPEPVVDAARTSLETNVGAVITAENTKHAGDGHGIVLDPIEHFTFGGSDIYAYPCVEVAVADLDLTNLSLAQLRADSMLRVLVRCSVYGPDSDTIYRMCSRYFNCIVAVLMQPDAFGPGLVLNQQRGLTGRFRNWELATQDDGKVDLFGAVLIEFRVEASETRL